MSELRSLLSTLLALGALAFLFAMLPGRAAAPQTSHSPAVTETERESQPANAAIATQPASTTDTSTPPKPQDAARGTATAEPVKRPENPYLEPKKEATAEGEVLRIEQPYTFSPLSFETVNLDARTALVNIFCTPDGGSLSPISGSGVLIDPRGVILTNAHVAQYVLLSQSPSVDLRCTVRTGSPAAPRYNVSVLYLPETWVNEHASEILSRRPEGTGEHDWALLRITSTIPSIDTPLPDRFPFVSPDVRETVAFSGDHVLAAAYPAEFIGGIVAQMGLYPVSSISAVSQLLTFATSSVDLISIGGVVEAQSGSSGGPVLNQWGRLVGIITTTSAGETTAQRDLRALTLSYINRDIENSTGQNLARYLADNLDMQEKIFDEAYLQDLIARYITILKR